MHWGRRAEHLDDVPSTSMLLNYDSLGDEISPEGCFFCVCHQALSATPFPDIIGSTVCCSFFVDVAGPYTNIMMTPSHPPPPLPVLTSSVYATISEHPSATFPTAALALQWQRCLPSSKLTCSLKTASQRKRFIASAGLVDRCTASVKRTSTSPCFVLFHLPFLKEETALSEY